MSKEKILTRIRANKPAGNFLPEVPLFRRGIKDLKQSFIDQAEKSASRCISLIDHKELTAMIKVQFPDAKQIVSSFSAYPGNVNLSEIGDPTELKDVDLAIIPAQIGVGENGAVWVSESECVHRVLPFITQHLLVVLNEDQLLWNLHEAYRRIKIDETGFGVFISGPSKTADIEQSLVIGAQGARSFTIVILDKK